MIKSCLKAGALFVFLVTGVQNAQATPVHFDFFGAFNDQYTGGGDFAGQSITGSFTVDVSNLAAPFLMFADPVNAAASPFDPLIDFHIQLGDSGQYSFDLPDMTPTFPSQSDRGAFSFIARDDSGLGSSQDFTQINALDELGSQLMIQQWDQEIVQLLFLGYDGSFGIGTLTELSEGRLEVPEPSTALMLIPGLLGFFYWTRRRVHA
ncbi:hypothetical protein JCM17960_00590 [Magnetospira thiophila]